MMPQICHRREPSANARAVQRIIRALVHVRIDGMEAEQLNQIANTLAALRDREAQLRRYL